MGTNFYHRTNICTCCNRYDERHICKSGVSFQGYRNDSQDMFLGPPVPPTYPREILSWADWKAVICEGGEVWDEYGTHWNVAEFLAYVEDSTREERGWQYQWVQEHRNEPYTQHDRYWLDPDGFSFYDGEFF